MRLGATKSANRAHTGATPLTPKDRMLENRETWSAVALQDHLVRSLGLAPKRAPHRVAPLGKATGGRRRPGAPGATPGGQRRQLPSRTPAAPPDPNEPLSDDEEEQARRYKLTLAQQLGLVEAPPSPLSKDEWSRIRAASQRRADSTQPCAICREAFRTEEQVLLSCSHVFHKACLGAFERHAKVATCPLCRKDKYQKRLIRDGARAYTTTCATKIQAVFRGFRARKRYKELRMTVAPKDPRLRKQWAADKLTRHTDNLLDALDRNRESSIDALFAEIDSSLRLSNTVFGTQPAPPAAPPLSGRQWERTQLAAIERDFTECPICLIAFCESGKTRVLLSCSHVFHDQCLRSFEEFNTDAVHQCPLCRSSYTKLLVPT